jgi:hypothetical protein
MPPWGGSGASEALPNKSHAFDVRGMIYPLGDGSAGVRTTTLTVISHCSAEAGKCQATAPSGRR